MYWLWKQGLAAVAEKGRGRELELALGKNGTV